MRYPVQTAHLGGSVRANAGGHGLAAAMPRQYSEWCVGFLESDRRNPYRYRFLSFQYRPAARQVLDNAVCAPD